MPTKSVPVKPVRGNLLITVTFLIPDTLVMTCPVQDTQTLASPITRASIPALPMIMTFTIKAVLILTHHPPENLFLFFTNLTIK